MSSDLPPGWVQTILGTEIHLQRGFDITKATMRNGNVPVIASGGLSGYHDAAMDLGPGVIIGRKGTLGTAYYSEGPYWPSDTTLWVRDFGANDPRWVYYFFKTFDALALDVGSANPTLNRNHVHQVSVNWPPPPEQRRIAGVLGALDDKIEHHRRVNERLEAFLASLFRHSFLRIAFNVRPLGDVLSLLESGGRPRGGVAAYAAGVPSIGAESIVGLGRFDYSKTKFVPREFFSEMSRGVLADRDVLLYKDGGRPGEFEPHATMVGLGFPFVESCINEHVYRVRVAPPYSQEFLFFWLESEPARAEMRRRGTGVAVPGLNSTAVRELPIPDVAEDAMRSFDGAAEPLVSQILTNSRSAGTLATLRDELLPRLVSGEIRVSADHEPAT